MKTKNKNRAVNSLLKIGMVWTILLIALGVMFIVAIAVGSSRIPLAEVIDVFFGRAESTTTTIVNSLRIPRALLAVILCACL